jgi:hypothetical protein
VNNWLVPERQVEMPGRFGGGFRAGFRGGGFGMRRVGFPFLGMGMGFGMGPLFTGLMAGGLGYLLGSHSNPGPNPQTVPGYSQAQPGANPDTLVQLKLLGELHDKGILTDEEFTREKNRLLGR